MYSVKIRGTDRFPTEWLTLELEVDVSANRIDLSGPGVCALWSRFERVGLGNQTFEIEWTQRVFCGCHLLAGAGLSGSVQRTRTQLAFDFEQEHSLQ
jgi:hypothetical protein